MKNNPVTIICSAVGCPAAAGFLKFLRKSGFRVVGTDITDLSAGKFFVDRFYVVPKAGDEEKTMAAYGGIIKKEKARWVISGPEEEILLLARRRYDIEKLGAGVFHPPVETLEIITDKLAANKFFSDKTQIRVPMTYDIGKTGPGLPGGRVILKPRRGRGSRDIFMADKSSIGLYRKILPPGEYIAQEFIDGEEFTVDALYGMGGNVLNIIPRKRLKTDSGISVISETVRDQALLNMVLEISGCLKFAGGNCFQFIRNRRGGYYLTDINPRFGGGSILSLEASKPFRANTIGLLCGKYRKAAKPSFDFKKMSMYRHYGETYGV